MFEELIKKLNQCELIMIDYRRIHYDELTRKIANYNCTKAVTWLVNDDDEGHNFEYIDKINFKNNGFIARKGSNYYYFKIEDILGIYGKYTDNNEGWDIKFRNESYDNFIKELLHLVNRK